MPVVSHESRFALNVSERSLSNSKAPKNVTTMLPARKRLPTVLLVLAGLAFPLAPRAGESAAMTLARQLNQAFVEVAEKVSPSVVVISISRPPRAGGELLGEKNPLWEFLPPRFRRHLQPGPDGDAKRMPRISAQGSGVVVREDGYIVTNSHVVKEAEEIRVRLKDGREFPGSVWGVDEQSDLAVIKIGATGLPAARFADYSQVRVGEFAIAIGAPFDLEYSVTYGHVSAKGRSGIINDPAADQDFIQTDANINPGNSGGPLVNIDGEVIGINTLIRGMNTGIGFAIPSHLVREVTTQLIEHGRFTRAWLGIEIRALRTYPEFRSRVPDLREGVVVMGIMRDGPAARSELRLGDVIVAVGDRSVSTPQELKNEIRSQPIGQPVALQVGRGKERVTVEVRPEAWPEDPVELALRKRPPAQEHSEDLGLTVRSLTPAIARQYDLTDVRGVAVTEVDPGSPAERSGLRHGDVITKVDGKPVATLEAYRAALGSADRSQGIMINLIRRGVNRFVLLKETDE
jgi:serine protease Do